MPVHLEEARTPAQDNTEWKAAGKCQSPMVEAEGLGPETRQWLAEAMWGPCHAEPFDNMGVLPVPTWTCLPEAGYF